MYSKKIFNPSWGARNDKYKGYNKNNFTADLSQILRIDFDQESDDVNEIYMDWKNRFLFLNINNKIK